MQQKECISNHFSSTDIFSKYTEEMIYKFQISHEYLRIHFVTTLQVFLFQNQNHTLELGCSGVCQW